MVTATGTTAAAYTYDPYGAHATVTGTGAATNPYRFKSGRHISTGTTGDLYKYGARYYDSGTTKWTQPDPAQDDTNTYRYTQNDPINNSDPSGFHSTSRSGGERCARGAAQGGTVAGIGVVGVIAATTVGTGGTLTAPAAVLGLAGIIVGLSTGCLTGFLSGYA